MDEKVHSDPSLSTFSGCNERNCHCKNTETQNYTFNPPNMAYATVPYFPSESIGNLKHSMNGSKMDTKRFWSSDNFVNGANDYEKGLPRGYSIYQGWGANPNNTHYGDGIYDRHITPHSNGINNVNYQTADNLHNLEYSLSQSYPFRPLYPLEHLNPANGLGNRYRRSYGGAPSYNLSHEDKIRRKSTKPFCC